MAESSTFGKLSIAKIQEITGNATDAIPETTTSHKMSPLTQLPRV